MAFHSYTSLENNSCTFVLSKLHLDAVTECDIDVHCMSELLLVSTKDLDVSFISDTLPVQHVREGYEAKAEQQGRLRVTLKDYPFDAS